MLKLRHQVKAGFLGTAIALFGVPAIAQMGSPTFYDGYWPDGNGDYPIRQEYVGNWQVVDSDPEGLNCRGNIPPGGGSETIVAKFYEGDFIQAVSRGRGIYEIEELDGKPWLRVRLSDGGECWIRANELYIEPR